MWSKDCRVEFRWAFVELFKQCFKTINVIGLEEQNHSAFWKRCFTSADFTVGDTEYVPTFIVFKNDVTARATH